MTKFDPIAFNFVRLRDFAHSAEATRHVLKALRLDGTPPHVLRQGGNGKLQCDPID